MNSEMTCPACAEKGSEDWVYHHFFFQHLKDNGRYRCFCADRLTFGDWDPKRRWVAHCLEHGGLTRHYLECVLGVGS